MQEIYKKLLKELESKPLEWEESDDRTVLGIFSFLYTMHHNFENGYMRERFEEMDKYLLMLPREEHMQLYTLFVNIYGENEKLAFQEGMRLGYQLAKELEDRGQ